MNKTNLTKNRTHVVIFLVFIAIIVGFFYIAISQKNKENNNESILNNEFDEKTPLQDVANDIEYEPEFSIDISLCENFEGNCIQKERFKKKDSVFIHIDVNNLKEQEGKVSFREELVVTNPNNEVLKEVSKVWLEQELESHGFLTLYNEIVTEDSDLLGNYKIMAIVTDKYSGKFVSKTIEFYLD